MRSDKFGPEPRALSPAQIVFVCTNESSASIRYLLARHSTHDWEREGSIRLVETARSSHTRDNAALIRGVAPPMEAARIVVIGEVQLPAAFGSMGDLRSTTFVRSLYGLERVLPKLLQQCRLDWATLVAARLSSWIHAPIDKAHIERWLRQFERLRERWLGEHLLKALDFWNPEQLRSAIGLNAATMTYFDCLSLNRIRLGKSADFLGNLLAKTAHSVRSDFPFYDFRDCFEDDRTFASVRRILFVEDCLFTGTEMTNYLSVLLGLREHAVYRPLSQPQRLREREVEMRFAAASSLGELRLTQFLKDQRLENIRLNIAPEKVFDVLTASGRAALSAGLLYEDDSALRNCLRDPHLNIERQALRGPWKDPSQRDRAAVLIETIGNALFRNYIKMVKYDWDDRKIARSSFGMHGFGMTLGFAHSIPKASLPLFWMYGEVPFSGGAIQWSPLFQNAAF